MPMLEPPYRVARALDFALSLALVLALVPALSAPAGAHPPSVDGSPASRPAPDPEVLRARAEAEERELDSAFEAFIAMDSAEPGEVWRAWDHLRHLAFELTVSRNQIQGPDDDPLEGLDELREGLLRRWEEARPESGGPALLRFRSRTELVGEELRVAEMALMDRYRDDPLVVSVVISSRRNPRTPRIRAFLEGFVDRNPELSLGHRMLYSDARGDRVRETEVLLRWAREVPGDVRVVFPWLSSRLHETQPERTDRMVRELFEGRPEGDRGFSACDNVYHWLGRGPHRPAALDCIRRIATDPETPLETQEKAGTFLLRRAVREDDHPELRAVLASLQPEARARALIEASAGLPDEDCTEVVALTRLAREEPMAEDLHGRAARILTHYCFDLPAARELYLDLLAAAPGTETANFVWSGLIQGDDGWRGDLPEGTVAVLVERLEGESGPPVEIYQALDAAYQATERDSRRRAEHLERWQRDHACDFDSFRAIDLAELWGRLGELERGIAVLARQADRRSYYGLVETLWDLHRQAGRASGAEPPPEETLEALDPRCAWRAHELVARDTLAAGDRATAEWHLWEAARQTRRDGVAAALFELIASEDPERAVRSTQQICSLSLAPASPEQVARCRSELLAGLDGAEP